MIPRFAGNVQNSGKRVNLSVFSRTACSTETQKLIKLVKYCISRGGGHGPYRMNEIATEQNIAKQKRDVFDAMQNHNHWICIQ